MTAAARDPQEQLRRAATALREMRLRLDALEAGRHEPIAIVGMGCRLPGGVETPEGYRRMLLEGSDATGEVPAERWDAAALYDPDPERPGRIPTLRGGFLGAIDGFDAAFFGIAPREAASIDPQQRLLLEVAWEALERGGLDPTALRGSRGGVFLGICMIDYARRLLDRPPETIDAYAGTGGLHSVASGRISYLLGLQGPSLSIDTACSSSLVAVHLACQSLRNRECDFALAGGVNLLLDPGLSLTFSRARMLAGDGRCKAFDASADGYGRAEGCGVVVLKRLSDALVDGDAIEAVIRGSAVNQDGASSGLTVPNGPAQQAVIRAALAAAGAGPEAVGYVEAHGTGTALGDPIELGALGAVLGEAHAPDDPLWVGSVKTNIGHAEGAAGIAGLIKAALVLRHGEIPPHLHLRQPNPHADWQGGRLAVPTAAQPWPAGRSLAGVSSFGFSGTNAHVLLEAPPACEAEAPAAGPALLTLSARTPAALEAAAARLADHLEAQPGLDLASVCATLARRPAFEHRLALVAGSTAEAAERLRRAPAPAAAAEQAAELQAAGDRWMAGEEIDRQALAGGRRRPLALPTYPWQRSRHWVEAAPRMAGTSETQGHPLLGRRLPAATGPRPFLAMLSAKSPDWLADHRVLGRVVLPAAACLEMALAAGEGLSPADVVLESPLALETPTAVQLLLSQDGFEVFAVAEEHLEEAAPPWARHALGRLLPRRALPAALDIDALEAACPERVTVEDFYAGQLRRGIALGPAFRRIVGLRRGNGCALARIEPSAGVPAGGAFHADPLLLDAGLQVAAVLAEQGGPALVPAGLGRLDLWAPLAGPLLVEARLRDGQGQDGLRVDLLFVAADGRPLAAVEDLRLRPARAAAARDVLEDLAYEVVWRPHPHPDERPLSDWLPSAGGIAATAAPALAERFGGSEAARYAAFVARSDGLCADYVAAALAGLGFDPRPGERILPDELARRLGVAARNGDLLRHLLGWLAEEGRLRSDGAGWSVLRSLHEGRAETESQRRQLLRDFPEAEPELTLLGRCGNALAAVLKGEADPLALLFGDGDAGAAARLYAASPWSRGMNGLLADAAAAALKSLPADRTLRVLEIGGGTGGATRLLCPLLPAERTDYCFTDVSPHFLRRTLAELAGHGFLRGQRLDIERDPTVQDFAPGSFDLVVAANVLHATADLAQSLRHARSLLAPEGLLLLLEGSGVLRWGDLTFGLTEGWWRFTDRRLRPDHPMLPAGRWPALLEEAGFAESALLDPAASAGGAAYRQLVVVARNAARTAAAPAAGGRWLLLGKQDGLGAELAAALSAAGARLHRAADIDPLSREGFSEAVAAAGDGDLAGVVHLGGLEAGEDLEEGLRCGVASSLHLLQTLADAGYAGPLWFLTQGAVAAGSAAVSAPAQAGLQGLARVAALEHPEIVCRCLDLAPGTTAEAVARELLRPDGEDSLALRDEGRYAARLQRLERPAPLALPAGEAAFRIEAAGTGPDALAVRPETRSAPGPGMIEVRVRAAGVNFRDLLVSLDAYPDGEAAGRPLGLEVSGEVSAVGPDVEDLRPGDPVVAVPGGGGFGRFVTLSASLVAPKPAALGHATAAALPAAYLTAARALRELAKLRAGERVLIHAAAGGTGLAALRIAQAAGAEVFATASPAKWPLLRRLGVRHLASSRDLGFVEVFRAATGGQGVEVVLNALAGPFIPASLSLLAPGGRFVEIGRRDAWSPEAVALERPDVAYHRLDLAAELRARPEAVGRLLRSLLLEVESGHLPVLPLQRLPLSRAATALRQLQQARQLGKLVLTEEEEGPPLRPDRSYLVTGGLGGLGLLVARRLAEGGARHLVLAGRRPPSPEAEAALDSLRPLVDDLRVLRLDASDVASVAEVIAEMADRGLPLGGLVHAAGALDDAPLQRQDWSRSAPVMNAKARGAWALHEATRDLELDFFILFSSAVALIGNPGQANHAAANAVLDALADHRRALGLPALAIGWGPWSGSGAAVDRGLEATLQSRGLRALEPAQGLAAFGRLACEAVSHAGLVVVDWPLLGASRPTGSFLSALITPGGGRTVTPASSLQQALAGGDREALRQALAAEVSESLAAALGLPDGTSVDPQRGFFELGLDSLTAIELRNRLQKSLDRALPAALAIDYGTVERLAAYLLRLLEGERDTDGEGQEGDSASGRFDGLDEAAVNALLDDRLARLEAGSDP